MPRRDTKELARRIRVHVLRMTHSARASHVGSCFSAADVLAVLYGRVLQVDPFNPEKADRDRMVFSKGHAAAALYAVLAESGFFPVNRLQGFGLDGDALAGHVTNHGVPGVEVSTGSLGHGVALGCGMALALRALKPPPRAFVLASDGELDEGSTWESILFAGHHDLGNLCLIVDFNKIQSFGRVSEVLEIEPLADKFRSFGWTAEELDGHDHRELERALTFDAEVQPPRAIIAHTVKGKGVAFMEDRLEWHYRSPSDDELLEALRELGEGG